MSVDPETLDRMAGFMAARVPHAAAMGLRLLAFGEGRGRVEVRWREELSDGDDAIASNVLTSLLDQACGMAIASALDTTPFSAATLGLRIDHVRPIAPGTDVTAEAHCYRVEGSSIFVRGEAWDRDREDVVATLQGAFMALRA